MRSISANAPSVNTPVAISAITTGLGILCVLLILFRIISPPDFGAGDFGLGGAVDTTRKIGVFLGLIAVGGNRLRRLARDGGGGHLASATRSTGHAGRGLPAASAAALPPAS